MTAQSSMKLENANYERVILALERLLASNAQYCHCMRCRLDATAIALNGLPPRYFITPSPMEIDELASAWLMVEATVMQALERVSQYPHHDKAEKIVDENIRKLSEKLKERELK
ncbi:MAG: late competence development ComFB family protein [Nitrospirota bacterium]